MPKKQPGLIDVERYRDLRPNRGLTDMTSGTTRHVRGVAMVQDYTGQAQDWWRPAQAPASASFVAPGPSKAIERPDALMFTVAPVKRKKK